MDLGPDQCLTLPGEIAQIVLQHLWRECNAHWCAAQYLLHLGSRAESGSLLGQMLLQLDEQGQLKDSLSLAMAAAFSDIGY